MKFTRRVKIGLLGGSFNPAHSGHLQISEAARKRLQLTQVWWLVSPGNPLKDIKGMMKFDQRLQSAFKIVGKNAAIRVLDLEDKLGTRYTVDTLKRLKAKYPQCRFYWLMGADNLVQLLRWKKWEDIVKMVEVHVFDRDKFFYKAVAGKAYQRYRKRIFYHLIKKNPLSSTQLRMLDKFL